MDYENLGLACGIEIHQQLDTHKLFCECPSALRDDDPDILVERKMRAVAGELGKVDPAALHEFLRDRTFKYEAYSDTTCDVELDDEPPHKPNQEAIDIALEVALLLHANVVDEIHFMRKTVIDGSNTSGFQRTAIVAMDGYLDTVEGKVRIPTICLEEEAARIIERKPKAVTYRLDRLGIPLIEIGTGPDIKSPAHAREVAEKLGGILRATGKVRRGLGTIRQDVNISIQKGARIEVKGAQSLRLIPKLVKNEVRRQVALLEIRDVLKQLDVQKKDLKKDFVDITPIFEGTKSKIIRENLDSRIVLAVKLAGFKGLLGKEIQPNRRFGTELADYASITAGVKGIFHTDELPGFGIAEDEVKKVREKLGATDQDAVVIIAGEKEKVEKGLAAVVDRAKKALDGVPKESRRALPDGNTQYMRPLPGAARMYPETDIPPIEVTEEQLARTKKSLPELPKTREERFVKEYGLSEELGHQMVKSAYADFFESIIERYGLDGTLVANTLTSTLKQLEKDDVDIEKLTENHLEQVFRLVADEKIAKEGIPEVLTALAQNPKEKPAKLAEKLDLTMLPQTALETIIDKVVTQKMALVEERGMRAMAPLMGVVMEQVRGKADGELVSKLLKEKLEKVT